MTNNPSMQGIRPNRIETVDMLRGIMACGIMAYHYSYWLHLSLPAVVNGFLVKIGVYGVEAFFVISGFSLFVAYRRKSLMSWNGLLAYSQSRAFRLLPLYVFAVITMLLLFPEAPSLLVIVGNMTLTFAFRNATAGIPVGGWSIGVEVVLSSLAPLLIALAIANRSLFSSVVVGCFGLLIFWQVEFGSVWAAYAQAPNHLFFFSAGIYLGYLHSCGLRLKKSGAFITVVLFTLAFIAFMPEAVSWTELVVGWPRLVFSIFSIGIVATVALTEFGSGENWRVVKFLGLISYSIYLMHPIVYYTLERSIALPSAIMFFLCVGVTLMLSFYSFQYLERPMMRFGKAQLIRV